MLGIATVAALAFLGAYLTYGRWVARRLGISDAAPTPAQKVNDGEDFVPTRPAILLGQHFAAIAAVGPIAGPILAGHHYGWLPGLIWIILGTIFIGAVHDFTCLVASVRHDARSIGDVIRLYVGRRASIIFSVFIWLSLVYIIVVFTDLTASAFVSRPELGDLNFGPGVATSSLLYLALSVLMGLALTRWKTSLTWTSLAFVPLIFVAIWLGQKIPLSFPGEILTQQRYWNIFILFYCLIASLIPMWVLLQPRGYLGGFILYATFAVGAGGLLFGHHTPKFPAITMPTSGFPLFPLLFTTIACGACSGFHGLVSSGTTSKQLAKESHAPLIGYGGMLLEGFVAVIAMSTLMLQAPGSPELGHGPDEVYARGLAHFMTVFGLPFAAGVTFGKLAFATFIYDTLDVATRLGRYLVQELLGLKGRKGAVIATIATLAVPAATVFMTFRNEAGVALPLWKIFWPAFGASNQLLAALSLAGMTVWLKKTGRNWLITGIPAVFMSVITIGSLFLLVRKAVLAGRWIDPVGTTGAILLILAVLLLGQAGKATFSNKHPAEMAK